MINLHSNFFIGGITLVLMVISGFVTIFILFSISKFLKENEK